MEEGRRDEGREGSREGWMKRQRGERRREGGREEGGREEEKEGRREEGSEWKEWREYTVILEKNAEVKECNFFPYWGFEVKMLFKESI